MAEANDRSAKRNRQSLVGDALLALSVIVLIGMGALGLVLIGAGTLAAEFVRRGELTPGEAAVWTAAPLVGVWLLIIGATLLIVSFLWRAGSKIVGSAGASNSGFRTTVLVVAIVVAAAASPPAVRDVLRIGESVARLALITTPGLLADAEALNAGRGAEATSPALLLLECFEADWPGPSVDGDRAAMIPEMTRDAGSGETRTNRYCRRAPIVWEAAASHWFLSLGVLLLGLVLGRSLLEAHERHYDPTPRAASDPKPVISYGLWLALLVYGAILAPATYLAAGSLVLLQSPAPATALTLEAALANAPSASNDALVQALADSDELTGPARALRARILQSAAGIDATFANEAYEAEAALAPARFAERVAFLREWRTVSRNHFADLLRHCGREELATGSSQPPPPPSVAPTSGTAPTATYDFGFIQDVESQEAERARDVCDGGEYWDPKQTVNTERRDFIDRVYPWLGEDRSSRPVLLMMGLLGFGLFGSAIRAMARKEKLVAEDAESNGAVKLDAGQFGAIIFQGAGAAMAVFLAFQAGALVFTGGENVSPFPQLLFVFLGAVFAEEVWSWGKSALQGVLGRAKGRAGGRLEEGRTDAEASVASAVAAARDRIAKLPGTTPAATRTAAAARLEQVEVALVKAKRDFEAAFTREQGSAAQAARAPNADSLRAWSDHVAQAETALTTLQAAAKQLVAAAEAIARPA